MIDRIQLISIFQEVKDEKYQYNELFLQKIKDLFNKDVWREIENSDDHVLLQAFSRVVTQYPAFIWDLYQQSHKHFDPAFISRFDEFEQIMGNYQTKALDLKFTPQETKDENKKSSCNQYNPLQFRGKKTQEDSEENDQDRYPHRVAEIIDILQDGLQGKRAKNADYQKLPKSYPDAVDQAIGAIRKATEAINHPKKHCLRFRMWARTEETNQFYNGIIDDLVYVDNAALVQIKNSIELHAREEKFDLGGWGNCGGKTLNDLLETDEKSNLLINKKVPHRVREIYRQIQLALAAKTDPLAKKNAIREIAKSAAEALANGKGSQTKKTRKFYYEILEYLVTKRPPLESRLAYRKKQ